MRIEGSLSCNLASAVARQDSIPVDDAVPLKPEDLRVLVPIPHSKACAGAATGVVLRRIAYRAGAYAPGIQEFLFHDLTTPGAGRTLGAVADWLGVYGDQLHAMGYRVSGRRVMGERTDDILTWVREGKGYRGAVLETDYARMHPAETDDCAHAVGVTFDRVEPTAGEDLVMIDPWPGTMNGATDRGPLSPRLEPAHRCQKYAALIFYWAGWS
jgi:hypothetical protein